MSIASPTDRIRTLEAKRSLKMARSAHAYVRGNTAKFYEWLAASPAAKLVPQGPAIWICGDCHLGNLGPITDGEGNVDIQIRDLDQAVIGNPAHDLIRLGLSLATAARGSDLPGVAIAHMVEELVAGYAAAMNDPDGEDRGPEPDAVRSVRRKALSRKWRHLAEERFEAIEPNIPLGKKFLALATEEQAALRSVFEDPEAARLVLALARKDADCAIRVLDAAYWIKGCSSLGLHRYAVLLGVKNAKERSSYALIDMKEAVLPIAPVARGAIMPTDNAARVVAAARALSPHLGERMIPIRMQDRSFFIRELAPQDLKLEVNQFSESQGAKAAHYLAFVVGKAHAQQLSGAERAAWRAQLEADSCKSIDAPNWLWESIVSLAGSHEVGYLEHCRRYALAA